ncbi:DUF4198 domain-containing protein [Pararhodobacter oceanensis]|uniref:DUF4198 domain-containing protein n=1 Tax=Pararhodobacter oceanensis TaxID=2172121 RepID=A0A2T8HV34_9RHOB|nr:DUF4198 domain-containing protein [Pararhodobacter oceanensis]PVH29307.1 DUF4198 domain-containing protein [Pararhodobacter oceanensis]
MRNLSSLLSAAPVLLLSAFPTVGHELWIEPRSFSIAIDAPLIADIRVGQEFSGATLSFIPRNFTRFEIASGATIQPVEGQLGAKPAVSTEPLDDGLAIVLYETTGSYLTYDDLPQFERFAAHKDFDDAIERHLARGLPEADFTEVYTRHVKSLIAVGDGAGEDRAFGLRTEFVALANPYTDDLSAGLPMLLLFDGAPRPDAQVELFDRAPTGAVTVTLHRTDAEGHVLLPVTAGHTYMADAVELLEHDPEAPRNAVWQTLWASLTFAVPAG